MWLVFLIGRMKISDEFALPDLAAPESTIEAAELKLLSDPLGSLPDVLRFEEAESLFREVSDQLQPSALLYRQLALSNLFSLRLDYFSKWALLVFFVVSLLFRFKPPTSLISLMILHVFPRLLPLTITLTLPRFPPFPRFPPLLRRVQSALRLHSLCSA